MFETDEILLVKAIFFLFKSSNGGLLLEGRLCIETFFEPPSISLYNPFKRKNGAMLFYQVIRSIFKVNQKN